jgi:hypothetical protein
MKELMSVVREDKDMYTLLFTTVFNKMHLNLNSIKVDKFRVAEG